MMVRAKNNREFKTMLMEILTNEGYPDYAAALSGFKHVMMIPKDKNIIGYTDYKSIHLSSRLTDKELSIVARHEILHVLLKHNKRRQDFFDRMRWNIAADLELSHFYSAADNDAIKSSQLLCGGVNVERYPRYRDKIAEDIYRMLDEESLELRDQERGGERSESDDEKNNTDKKNRKIPQNRFRTGLESELTPEQEKALRNAITKAVQKAYKNGSDELRKAFEDGQVSQAADVVLSDAEDISKQEKPKVTDSVKLTYSLRKYFIRQQRVDKGRSYKRPNKKYLNSEIIVKARTNVYKSTKTLAVYVDQSGSMSYEKIKKAMAVTESIEGMKRVSIIKHYFDTSIHDSFKPGGGTDYEPIFLHAKKNHYTCLAIITDNSTSQFEDYYDVEALWLIGVEKGPKDDYSITSLVRNRQIRARKFEVAIVTEND